MGSVHESEVRVLHARPRLHSLPSQPLQTHASVIYTFSIVHMDPGWPRPIRCHQKGATLSGITAVAGSTHRRVRLVQDVEDDSAAGVWVLVDFVDDLDPPLQGDTPCFTGLPGRHTRLRGWSARNPSN